ncbi:MAG: AAA family ATPase [Endomicrobium sp.]|nr:AAA family ATPase [Endomicrobium sp.]
MFKLQFKGYNNETIANRDQTFEKLRTDNYVYVDKTEHIYNLISKGRVYFQEGLVNRC